MESNTVSKYTVSFGLSLALSSVFNALLVVTKEESKTVSTGMQKLTGNDWVTHVAGVIAVFCFFGWFLARGKSGRGPVASVNHLTQMILAGVVAGALMIAGFYLFAD